MSSYGVAHVLPIVSQAYVKGDQNIYKWFGNILHISCRINANNSVGVILQHKHNIYSSGVVSDCWRTCMRTVNDSKLRKSTVGVCV
jgi:hypothetical protein